MLIHTLPPRLMCRVMAIRADSICRLVTYAGSSAWMPYSPKVTRLPPLEAPPRLGWCCLRCLTRRGISIGSALLRRGGAAGGLGAGAGRGVLGRFVGRGRDIQVDRRVGRLGRPGLRGRGRLRGIGRPGAGDRRRTRRPAVASAAAAGRTVTARPTVALVAGAKRSLRGLLLARHDLVTLVDPDLDADAAERGPGLVEAEVDVGAQRVQRDATLAVELRARHLRAAEATRALHPDALRAALQRGLHRLSHRPPERHPAGQLLGHTLRDELRVDLGRLHLEDVEVDVLAGELLEVAADAVGLRAAAADDDARPGSVDVDVDAVTGALDLDPADAGPLHALRQHAANRDVFLHVVAVELVGVPAALVPGRDAQPEPVGVDLLSHQRVPSSGATT